MARAAAVLSSWAALGRRARTDRTTAIPQHGLGRNRIGPIAVGMIALVLLAGSSTSFGSSASGALPQRRNAGGNASQAFGVHPEVNLPPATVDPGARATLAGRIASPAIPRDLRLCALLDVAAVGGLRRQ